MTALDGAWEVRSATIHLWNRWADCSPGKSFNTSLDSSLRGEVTQRRRAPAVATDRAAGGACTHIDMVNLTGSHLDLCAALFAPRSKVAVC